MKNSGNEDYTCFNFTGKEYSVARKKKQKKGGNKFLLFLLLVFIAVTVYLGIMNYRLRQENMELEREVEELKVQLTILKGATP